MQNQSPVRINLIQEGVGRISGESTPGSGLRIPVPAPASRQVLRLFQEYRTREFLFVEPGGNFGDYLIYEGARKLARLAGIHYRSLTAQEFLQCAPPGDAVVYIHGSGGYVPMWPGSPIATFRHAITTHLGPTILGPTTFFTENDFLAKTIAADLNQARSREVYVLTRDQVSYSAVAGFVPDWVRLNQDHDTALNLVRSDLLSDNPRRAYALYAIREDKEGTTVKKRDLFVVWLDPARYCTSLDGWVRLHACAKRIVTNRLHSSIVGTILGIPTTLLPNSYHKNRAVWEFSLQQRGVQWMDGLPVRGLARAADTIPLIRRVLESYRLQSAVRSFYGVSND